jgi:hypothetical protein
MIPEKAIKKFNRPSYREIAVGTLISYGIFPQTQEGIEKAKKLIADKDEWLAPSELPNYYDGIDSDLLTGRETAGIIFIRNTLNEFYGITPLSAGTTDFVDTSVPTTTTPKEKKKNKLQPKPYAKDNVDRWSRLTGYELDSLDDYTRDQIRALASKYGVKRYSSYKDKGKLIEAIKDTDGYQQAAPQSVDTEVEEISSQEKSSEELTIKLPPAHYIQGTAGRWNPEFENDIDHAVYFAGKSPLPKGAKQKEVLNWLKSLGLTFEQIHDHREAVLEKIRETIALPGVEEEYPYVYIDAVDQDFVIEDDEEDDDNEIDPDLESKLDELLKPSKEELQEEDKSIADNITDTIKDVVGEEDEDEEDPMANVDIDIQAIADGDEDELTDVAGKLTAVLNKPKKESSYTSNKKIFDSITANFGRLQATLDVVNSNLEKQNSLIKASIESQLATGELIVNQTGMLGEKFDLLLQQFERQNDLAKQREENEKNKSAEDALESQRDAAGVSDFENLLEKDGKSKKRGSKITEYYKQKALRQLYRVLPRRLRSGIRKARNLRKIPGRMRSKVTSKVLSRSPQAVQRLARGAQAIRGAQSATRGAQALRGARNIGPARTLFAAMEYGERKGQGQSEVQALAGTGSGLAGASIGGALVTAGIALLPSAPTGVGAVAAGALIIAGSILGGNIGANVADSITGADQVTGEHETGTGLTKPGTAMLHGTEAVIPSDAVDMSPMNTVGGVMIASTAQFINSAGAVAAPIAPTFKGMAAQMAKEYDVPSTIAQTNVGGSLPSLDKELKKIKEKKKQTPEEELKGIEKDLLETQDPESFADKLLKMLDPEGKFQELLKQINHRNPVGETGEGMAIFGESGIDKGTGYNAKGWVHGHFQNSNKQSLVSDTLEVVKKLINSGVSTVITSTNKDLTKDMSEDELRRHIEAGVDGHKKYGSGVYAIDVSVPAGTKVPYELENVFDSKGPGGIVGTMKGRTTQIMHLAPGSKAGAAPGTTQVSPVAAPTGDYDVILPLDHVKPGNENKIPDKKGGNTFENARATGAAGRERQHQDKAAAKVKAKLEAKGLRVKVITPEDFGNYEDYDKYIMAQASKNVRIVPLHFDAAVGQGGTGFLTRIKKGDSGDAALARPIQQALSKFQKENPELGNLGPTDTVSNATINRASASPAALVEMGSMVAWEKHGGSNFTGSSTFDKLTTGIAEGIYQGGGFDKRLQPSSTQRPRFQSLQGTDNDSDTKYLIVNQAQRPNISLPGGGAFVEMSTGRWKSNVELSTTMRNLYIQRLGQ